MRKIRVSLLGQIAIAIVAGVGCGLFFADWATAIFITFNSIFSNLLAFVVPLIILGLVAPAIADLGRGAARLLLTTAALAYGFTIFSGFFTYFSCEAFLPLLLSESSAMAHSMSEGEAIKPYFTIEMPPLMEVMSALIAAFIFGLGLATIKGQTLKRVIEDFRDIILLLIERVIIPLLPIYIFGVFLNITSSGDIAEVMSLFIKVVTLIFALTIILLILQFGVAGALSGKNPIKMLRTMAPAYFTALGTQSSAATIPVTLKQTIKNGVSRNVAGFVIPLCATIHLSGSTLKIVACVMAIIFTQGLPLQFDALSGFILMLGIAMVAAPGVPGGAIMASIGLLESMLGFDETSVALMITLYIAMDSFGTACNVTGDGAIAAIIDRIYSNKPLSQNKI